MAKRLRIFIGIVAGMAILLAALWQTTPRWLPRVLSHWLPAGSQLTLQGPLRWQDGGLSLAGAQYKA
ncbi:hypothetical protein, partial [Serratia rubidaea]